MVIHLTAGISPPAARCPRFTGGTRATDTRDGPWILSATGQATRRPCLALAPHGVYRAPEVTLRAVGSYPAFSPLPRRPGSTRAPAVSSL